MPVVLKMRRSIYFQIRIAVPVLLLLAAGVVSAQGTSGKALLADGAQFPYTLDVYDDEAADVGQKLRNLAVRAAGIQRPGDGNIYIKVPIIGHFIDRTTDTKAYSYTLCKDGGECSTQGIIILGIDPKTSKTSPLANVAYPYRNDIQLTKVADINGDGIDEIGVLSNVKDVMSFRILDIANKRFAPLGKFEIYDINAQPSFRAKLYVETGGGRPTFFADKDIITGKGWTAAGLAQISAQPDDTKYAVRVYRLSIFKLLLFVTFVVQAIAFLFLMGKVIFEFIATIREPDNTDVEPRQKHGKADKKILLKRVPDGLPTLEPLTCLSCGGPLPLNEGEMTCPSCGTKAKAPASYFDVAAVRDELREKIRQAAAYLRRAKLLTSGWMRAALGLSAVWVGAAAVAILVLGSSDNFEPFQSMIRWQAGFEAVTIFGVATTLFWVVALAFTFLIWSPRIRRNIPKIDLGENIGKAEAGRCPQCGGGISYEPDDLATVCGYCGVEIYRARLAWKFYNAQNDASQKADFSLVQAKGAAEDAVEEVTGTPRVFMLLLLLFIIVYGGKWLLSAGYEHLPDGVQSFLNFLGELIDLL